MAGDYRPFVCERLPDARLDRHGDPLRPHLLQATQDQTQPGVCGEAVGVKQVSDRIWLVTFMDYDLGYFVTES
jgi:hypothetical protein